MPNRCKTHPRPQSLRNKAAKAIGRSLPMLMTGAALVAGAGSLLMAGSAKAAWNPVTGGYQCFFRLTTGGCTAGDTTPSPVGGDKLLTLLYWESIPTADAPESTSDLEFTYQPTDPTTPWHVDLDFNPDDSDGGFLSYKIEAIGGEFSLVNLISSRDENTSVTKKYGTRLLSDGYTVDPNSLIDTLNLTDNFFDKGPAYGSVLYVNDSWEGPGAIDNISNEFSQVPGPVPLLGAGAAFGFSRRLRRRLKGASLAQG
jgi:hypothetical protein